MKAPVYIYAPGEWGILANEWRISLVADNKSPNTIRIYLHAVRLLGEWSYRQEEVYEPTTITTTGIREYMGELLGRTTPGNAHNNYRALRTFFNWLDAEEEIDRSPMDKTKAPQLEEKPIPIATFDMVGAMLDTCEGKDFIDRRDNAIIRTFFDTGYRRAEALTNVDDVDLNIEAILVHGKGRRDRVIPISPKTSQAIGRYLRVRRRQPQAEMPALWLGATGQGRLKVPGIRAMIARRAKQAGVGHVHPHMFRHALAHYWQLEGGNENDLMFIMGWKSREMLKRYGASAATERAHKSHRTLRLGDRL